MIITHGSTGRTKRTVLLVVVLLLINLIPIRPAEAVWDPEGNPTVDPVRQSNNYSAVQYNNLNGLPTSEANDIVQTSEGFIWIGCYSGLIRYDGNDFIRMDSTTGIGSVTCLHVDRDDRLWIGTNDSGLAMMYRGEVRMWHEEDGLGSEKICDIDEDESGCVYVATTEGVVKVTPELSLVPMDDPKIANAYVDQMWMGKDGLFYCYTDEGNLFTLRDGELEEYTDHNGHDLIEIFRYIAYVTFAYSLTRDKAQWRHGGK